jgi:hypothetical protein
MIQMDDVVAAPDMEAPQPFQILRSTGAYVLGGFQSTTTTLVRVGPVQRASSKEIQMLPESDRVEGIMAFWSTQVMYVTSGKKPVPSLQGQTPAGAIPGTVYTLSSPLNSGSLYINGSFMIPNVDYTLVNGTITLALPTPSNAVLWFTNPSTDPNGPAESDILVYPPNGEQYRVLAVRYFPGSAFWKALATRTSAI